jgi:hypothetical protein
MQLLLLLHHKIITILLSRQIALQITPFEVSLVDLRGIIELVQGEVAVVD